MPLPLGLATTSSSALRNAVSVAVAGTASLDSLRLSPGKTYYATTSGPMILYFDKKCPKMGSKCIIY